MNLDRRDFLRGLAALAGVAVVGLPEVTEAVELPPALQGTMPDVWGWVEIGGHVFGLINADMRMHWRQNDPLWTEAATWTTYDPRLEAWDMCLTLFGATVDRVNDLLPVGPVAVVLHLHERTLRGRGCVTSVTHYGPSDFLSPLTATVQLIGRGPLTHEPA